MKAKLPLVPTHPLHLVDLEKELGEGEEEVDSRTWRARDRGLEAERVQTWSEAVLLTVLGVGANRRVVGDGAGADEVSTRSVSSRPGTIFGKI